MALERAAAEGPGGGAASSAAIVRRTLAAYGRGDEAAVLAGLHPDMEFVPMLVATGARREPYRGREGFREYLRDSRALGLDIRIDILSVHADGDIVVALAHLAGTASGGRIDAACTYVFRVLDGLIVHGIVGSDPDRAVSAFGLDQDPPSHPPGEHATTLEPLRLSVKAVPESVPTVRRAIDAYVGAAGGSIVTRQSVRLAITEACTNVVLHAYVDRREDAGPRPLVVTAVKRSGRLMVTVEDAGRGMVARDDSPGLGLGLVVIRRLAAACTITTAPERAAGSRLDLEFELPARVPVSG